MDLDDLHVWSGHQSDAGACTPPIVRGRFVLLDFRQPSSTEVPMRLIGLALVLSLLASLAAEAQQTGQRRQVGFLNVGSRESFSRNAVLAAVRQATTTVPIIMTSVTDPVGAGFIMSLSRPGGNITGATSDVTTEIWSKRLEFLKEAAQDQERGRGGRRGRASSLNVTGERRAR